MYNESKINKISKSPISSESCSRNT